MRRLLYLLFLLFPILAHSQIWSKIYVFPNGSETGTDVIATSDGGFVVAGGGGGHLFKVDANGAVVFRKYFANVNQAVDVVETQDGGYALLAFQEVSPPQAAEEVKLIRTNATGEELWRETFKVDPGNVVLISTQDNGFAIQGFQSPQEGFAFYILDDTGNVLYETDNGVGTRFIQLTNGDFVFVRNITFQNAPAGNDANFVYLNAEGETVWEQEVVGIRAVQQLADGNLIVSGYDSTGQVKALSKYDLEGNFIWQKTYPQLEGRIYQRLMNRLLVNERGEIAFSTLLDDGSTLLAKFDDEGNLLCSEIYSLGKYQGQFEGLDGTQDFGFIISGRAIPARITNNANDLFLIRTDSLCKTGELEIINVVEPEVEEPPIEFSFQYYPNPTSGIVNFEIQAEEAVFENLQLVFYDMLGRPVLMQTVEQANFPVNLTDLASACYTFKFYEGKMDIGTGRVIRIKE